MNQVKSILVALLVCMCTANVYAQKCKFKVDESDPFTNKRHRATTFLQLSGVPRWYITLEQKGDEYMATLNIFKLKDVRAMVTKGTIILAKLEDGNTVEFTADADATPTVNVEQLSIIVSQWTVICKLSKENLTKLSKSPIAFMRTTIGPEEVNMPDVHDKGVEKVVNFANCLLSAN